MCLIDGLERADIQWCAIGGVAVHHWVAGPMVTQDVDFVVATDAIEKAVAALGACPGTVGDWLILRSGTIAAMVGEQNVPVPLPARFVDCELPIDGALLLVNAG